MKKLTLTSLALLCYTAAFSTNYYLTGGSTESPLDISDLNNWWTNNNGTGTNPSSLTVSDDLFVYGFSEITSGSFSAPKSLAFDKTGSLLMSGSGASVTSLANGNKQYGEGSANSNVSIKILGTSNAFTSNYAGGSIKMGNVNSVSGENSFYVSSNNAEAKNTLTWTGINGFMTLSNNESSTAKNTVTIKDNSIFNITSNLALGGQNNAEIKGGENVIQMTGTNSTLTFGSGTLTVGTVRGNDSSITSGGTAKIIVGGSNNTFELAASNNFIISHYSFTNISGGEAAFIVNGTSNTVNIGKATTVGAANMTSDAKAGYRVSGTSNIITHTSSINTKGYSDFELKGAENSLILTSFVAENNSTLNIAGSKNYLNTTGNFTIKNSASLVVDGVNNFIDIKIGGGSLSVENDATVTIRGSVKGEETTGNYISASNITFGEDTTLTILAMANQESVLFSNGNFNLNGIMVIDFSDYIMQDLSLGDNVKLISLNNIANAASINNAIAEGRIEIIGTTDTTANLSWDGKTLVFHITNVVPEPSAYAAIFGALALAFAIYRRCK